MDIAGTEASGSKLPGAVTKLSGPSRGPQPMPATCCSPSCCGTALQECRDAIAGGRVHTEREGNQISPGSLHFCFSNWASTPMASKAVMATKHRNSPGSHLKTLNDDALNAPLN